ncbi:uncharacterized protein L969DRAFT_14556 [Mixia osmundae IAM 14324]|uniref:N-acetyltransferase domain-containing protein n=1 Tax=Mixia osmundae (strain CBS 9802 / IAM 14324 / JCM 22182 / KY 12970) TaxID=764103 RepID=G7EAK2_MIXOS|nr:uncharacterized protein L969DRAFT_14556 [Mixia osmundae IAM 14324]KEI42352.1 hypothetical protein L969DRAFT_14556 [Mixia osmundae IAM 14324]GAA99862.1 hypothetical protein E5Q_06565 [Mixia osmundae IAM 14324]
MTIDTLSSLGERLHYDFIPEGMAVLAAPGQVLSRYYLHIRTVVFVEEQGFTLELELDGKDDDCVHFVLFDTQVQPPLAIGTVRFVMRPKTKLGRLALLKEARGKGAGRIICLAMEHYVRDHQLATEISLHAQLQARGFYQKLGYRLIGEQFMEDDSPHVLMRRDL